MKQRLFFFTFAPCMPMEDRLSLSFPFIFLFLFSPPHLQPFVAQDEKIYTSIFTRLNEENIQPRLGEGIK